MRTVLLVEDQKQVREVIRRMLERSGCEVIAASDSSEALLREEEHLGRIDILLTDVILPGLSGPDLALKLNERRIGVRTLFMSGYPDEVVVRHLGEHFPCRFLQKPFGSEELTVTLRDLFFDFEVQVPHA